MRDGALNDLEETLGHRFANPDLLRRALTHGSAAGARPGHETYQRLEFLGDRVLGLVVADMLDRRFPQAPEGELSRRFNRLVSRETCAEVALEMKLEAAIRMSGGRPTTNVLGDACESILAALYRDGGLPVAAAIIGRYWQPRIEAMSGPLRDAKTELQEWAHRLSFPTPAYSEVLRSGPAHAPEFDVEVTVGDLPPGRGKGRSKRDAEQEAATVVLRREGVWNGD